jgi:hypothetical protein
VGSESEADTGNVIPTHKKTSMFAYMDVVAVRIFSKAKDKPCSLGDTGKQAIRDDWLF